MELRRWSICLAFFLLAVLSQSSEARHSLERRATDYDEVPQSDAGVDDYGQQNDADGGDDDDDSVVQDAKIESQPMKFNLNVGQSVNLPCTTNPADGVVVQWTRKTNKDETVLFLSNFNMVHDPRLSLHKQDLIIHDVTPQDSGTYTCAVQQRNRTELVHYVFVTEPARIVRLSASDNGHVVEGSNVLLTCDAAGSPPPTIYWSRSSDGGSTTTALTDADGKFSHNTFLIEKVSREQAGIYYCLVANSEGQKAAISSITITVAGKPKVHAHRTIVNTDIGTEAELICTTHPGHEEDIPVIQWRKDNAPIEEAGVSQYRIDTNGSRSTLIVSPQRENDFGAYSCMASNEHGTHSRWIELVQNPVVEDLDVDGPKLSWTVHSHQKLEAIELHLRNLNDSEDGQWISAEVPIPESANGRKYEVIYEVKDANVKDGKYEAIVKVKNEKGWSKQIDPVIVELESQPQSIQAATVLGAAGKSNMLRPSSVFLSTVLMYLLVRMF